MGSNISVEEDPTLAIGWGAPVGEYLIYNRRFGEPVALWTVNTVAALATSIKYKIQNTFEGGFVATLEEINDLVGQPDQRLPTVRTICAQLANCRLATNGDFVSLCDELVRRIVSRVLTHPVVMSSFNSALQKCLTQLCGDTGPISGAIATILTDAISQLSQKAAGSLAPDITTNALVALSGSRTDIANAHATSFFVTSVAINGGLLLYDLVRTYCAIRHEKNIRKKYKQYAKKKIAATFGTIVGGTAGGYVATLMAPNNFCIQFVGGFIGGIIGEQVGIMMIKIKKM